MREEKKRVLVAFEFSGIVRSAFEKEGFDAWSCDYRPSEIPGKHLICNVESALRLNWDLIIAHPPCTYLSKVAIQYLWNNPGRYRKMVQASSWFGKLLSHPCALVAIENPIPHRHAWIRKYNQICQPWQFGDAKSKATCWWLKGLPPLLPTSIKPKNSAWYAKLAKKDRSKERSRFHPGMAEAMVKQWGGLL